MRQHKIVLNTSCVNTLARFFLWNGQSSMLSRIQFSTNCTAPNVWTLKTKWPSRSPSSNCLKFVVRLLAAACLYGSHIRKVWFLHRLINVFDWMAYKFTQPPHCQPPLELLGFPAYVKENPGKVGPMWFVGFTQPQSHPCTCYMSDMLEQEPVSFQSLSIETRPSDDLGFGTHGDHKRINTNTSVPCILICPAYFSCFVRPFINGPTIVCLFIC